MLPERVALRRQLGGIGARSLAFIIDLLIRGFFMVALVAVAQFATLVSPSSLGLSMHLFITFTIVGIFIINWSYFVLFELLWDGQTPGKKALGLRVEGLDGLNPRFWQSAVRNLLRLVDSLPWGYGLGLSSVFLSPRGQRLGDILGGTMVVSVKKPLEGSERRFAIEELPHEQRAADTGMPYSQWELLQDYRRWSQARGAPSEAVAREVFRTCWASLSPAAREELSDLPFVSPPRAVEVLHGYLADTKAI